jgi:hypothetical protein
LNLHRLDRSIEAAARVVAPTQPLEVGGNVSIHGDDQIGACEVVRMDLPADVTEVVTTQSALVRGEWVGKIADMFTTGAGRVEADVLEIVSARHL